MGEPENSVISVNPVKIRGSLFIESAVDFWGHFSKNRVAVVGLGIVTIFGFLAIFALAIMTYGHRVVNIWAPQSSPHGIYKPSSNSHWFGTDGLGRDVFSRFIWGLEYRFLSGFWQPEYRYLWGLYLAQQPVI